MMRCRLFITCFLIFHLSSCTTNAANPAADSEPINVSANTSKSVLVTGLPDFTALVDKEGKAVVNISSRQIRRRVNNVLNGEGPDPFDLFRQFGLPVPPNMPQQPREEQAQSLGSGFIIAADGYVLTNAHVVADADEITVKLNDKREFKAKVIGADARSDIALLKINATSLPIVDIGSSEKLRVGEWVVAIGSPFGLDSSVTAGIVSAKSRDLPDESYVRMIQTDAAVNPGNSGGPLFNTRGEVVGVNAQIYSRSGGYMGLSFAIPIDTAMEVVQQLKVSGKVTRGRIGVAIQPLNDDLARDFGLKSTNGVLLNSIEPDSPAAKAGLKAGDVILKFDGKALEDAGELQRLVGSTKPGKRVPIEVWREKSAITLTIAVAEMQEPKKNANAPDNRAQKKSNAALNRSGLSLRELPPEAFKQLGIKFGVQVTNVQGVATRAGIRQGDVIVGIGSKNLDSLDTLIKVFKNAKPGQSVALRLRRGDASLFISLKIPDEGDEE